jgi:hypothetical protein
MLFFIQNILNQKEVKMAKKKKYRFGAHTGNDLKKLVWKYTSEAEKENFDKVKALAELCLGIVCNLVAHGYPLTVKDITEIWKKVN